MLEIEQRERKKQIGVMPPKKRLKQTKEKSAKANEARGSGSQSRIALDFEKLREAGWTIKQGERESSSGVKVYFRYTNPGGKTLKSAKDVERQLTSEGIYERFTTQEPQICQTDVRSNPAIPTDHIVDLAELVLKNNNFEFQIDGSRFLQERGTAVGIQGWRLHMRIYLCTTSNRSY